MLPRDVYERLADRLDALPNGFPRTKSGVELRLLAKMFDDEEAALASVMRLSFEAAPAIARRAGVAPAGTEEVLTRMARRGLVRVRGGRDGPVFSLLPFVVGIYEEQLPRMDEELARLFEEYLHETRGGPVTHGAPALQRIIPVGESIPLDIEIFPYERAAEYVERARSWGVRKCICRVQRRLIGEGCDHELENCIVFAPVPGAFEHSEATKPITKEEALTILERASEAGLVHSTLNQQNHVYYICNCCTCCCGILRGVAEFGVPTAVARSAFRAVVDTEACAGCGDCAARCMFGALSAADGVCRVDHDRCVGCGLCVLRCLTGAIRMERRSGVDAEPPPANRREWLAARARERGIRVEGVL